MNTIQYSTLFLYSFSDERTHALGRKKSRLCLNCPTKSSKVKMNVHTLQEERTHASESLLPKMVQKDDMKWSPKLSMLRNII